jgi:hypothetical protein
MNLDGGGNLGVSLRCAICQTPVLVIAVDMTVAVGRTTGISISSPECSPSLDSIAGQRAMWGGMYLTRDYLYIGT